MSQDFLRDREVFIERENLTGAEISGKGATSLLVVESRLQNCTFSDLSVKYACFGAGIAMSEYVDCTFDRSKITAVTPGRARFVRCSFRDVRLYKWLCNNVEMTECTFTGQLREVTFNAKVQDPARSELGRDVNEYRRNDFSGADLAWIGFRGGVDLSEQQFPATGDHFVVNERMLRAIIARVDTWDDGDARTRVRNYLDLAVENLESGQAQFLISPRDLKSKDPTDSASQRLREEIVAFPPAPPLARRTGER